MNAFGLARLTAVVLLASALSSCASSPEQIVLDAQETEDRLYGSSDFGNAVVFMFALEDMLEELDQADGDHSLLDEPSSTIFREISTHPDIEFIVGETTVDDIVGASERSADAYLDIAETQLALNPILRERKRAFTTGVDYSICRIMELPYERCDALRHPMER